MMTGFNPQSDEHKKGGNFLDEEGDFALAIVEIYRLTVGTGDHAIRCVANVLVGEHAGRQVSRMFKLTGKGTGWTRDLFLAVNQPQGVKDIHDDVELSRALGMRPFLGECRLGQAFKGNDGKTRQFVEISECKQLVGPLGQEVRKLGRQWGTKESIVLEEQRQTNDGRRRVTKEGPNPWADDDGGGRGNYGRSGGNHSQSGEYTDDYIPPGDDDIPF